MADQEMTEEQEAILKDFNEWTGGFHPAEVPVEEIEEYIELAWWTTWDEDNKDWFRKQGDM
jgi:hypothetical protein